MEDKSTQQIGFITEKECELFLIKQGFMVSTPEYYHSRYDFIVDIKNKLFKIQVKTSRPNTSSLKGFKMSTCSSGRNMQGNHKEIYTLEEVDFFMTCYDNNFYLIPIELCQTANSDKVFSEIRDNNTLCLKDFQAEKIINKILQNEPYYEIFKPVQQYDLQGEFINSYINTVEAIKTIKPDCMNPKQAAGHISAVINGSRKSAYGYIWKRIEE